MLVGNEKTMSATEVLLAFVVFFILLTILRSFRKQIPPGLRRPPGPKGYPLIGNILEVGKNPHLSLSQMKEKYGDVMKIHIGMTPLVVLSGLETLKQALLKQGEVFMGRPDLNTFRILAETQSFTFGRDWGVMWRTRKKMVQNALKTFSSSPSLTSPSICLLEEHVSQEASYLVTKFLQVMKEEGRFDPFRYMVISVANVICALVFGKRYSHDDEELLSIASKLEEIGKMASLGNLADFIPGLQYLPWMSLKRFKTLPVSIYGVFARKHVNNHYETFNKDHIRDITDSLIAQSQEKKLVEKNNIQLPEKEILNLVNDLLGAGFDTVTTALSWCLMYLVTYPEIQKRIQRDIDQTIGREKTPCLSDRTLLPYVEAFILEMFRHTSFLPFTLPRCTTKDTSLNGFYIPKDQCVFVNQWQVNHDEKLWTDPSSFSPERFLSADGTEIDRAESEKVLVFGLGKRRCIGEVIGRWEIFLFLTTLLQQLEFTVCEGGVVDLTPEYGLVMKHKRCEHFQVQKRFPEESSK